MLREQAVPLNIIGEANVEDHSSNTDQEMAEEVIEREVPVQIEEAVVEEEGKGEDPIEIVQELAQIDQSVDRTESEEATVELQ